MFSIPLLCDDDFSPAQLAAPCSGGGDAIILKVHMLSIIAGLAAGAGHVLAGPDHLGAVAPLAARSPGAAWRAGLRWGLGHTAGVVLVGAFFLTLRDVLPIDLISGWSERLVGVVLVAIGLWGLRAALDRRVHAHAHRHGQDTHVHMHAHGSGTTHPVAAPSRHDHSHAAFGVGTLHGLAGSSHVLGVIPALAFPSALDAVTYLAAFGIGTVAAMVCFAAVVGLVARGSSRQGLAAYRAVLGVCSVAAVGIGVYWLGV
jgi:sulfite exporter TauE/SafE